MRKRITAGLAGTVAVVAAATAWNRRSQGRSEQPALGPGEAYGAAESYLTRLAEAVRIPTVSHEDRDQIDRGAFDAMHEFLWRTYPTVFETLRAEVIGGHGILLTWAGSDAHSDSVVVMAHSDVVPVEPGTEDGWDHGPFSGHRDGEHLWGRGALDDKASLIGIMEALDALVSSGFRPTRTLHVVLGHDEEIGGQRGALQIAATLAEHDTDVALVLDEGGAVVEELLPGLDRPVALIGIGEKGYVNIRLTARADGGHSSMPPERAAPAMLAAAVTALDASPMPTRIEVQHAFFAALAPLLSLPERLVFRWPDRFEGLLEKRLAANRRTNALIRTTGVTTILDAGVKPNVVPQEAHAVVNFRILPGDTLDGVVEHVRSVVGDHIEVEVDPGGFTADPPPLADTAADGWALLTSVIDDVFPEASPVPYIGTGATDSRHFAQIADTVLRFIPFTVHISDMSRVHGTGERLAESDAARIPLFYRKFIERACG